MIIYQAYKKDEPVFYIGKTVKTLEHRRSQHENESEYNRTKSHFHRAIKKYGKESFDWVILETCQSVDELNNAERRWIKLLRECNHRVYNITDGGEGGDCGGSRYWKEHGIREETKQKISQSLKKYYSEHPSANKGKSRIGKKHTEESKNKISTSKLGHIVSDETKLKLRNANLGKSLNPEVLEILKEKFKGANNPSAKSIICTTTGEIFDYATLAAQKYNIDLSSIIKCCKGKIKSVKKMKFQYYPAGWLLIG